MILKKNFDNFSAFWQFLDNFPAISQLPSSFLGPNTSNRSNDDVHRQHRSNTYSNGAAGDAAHRPDHDPAHDPADHPHNDARNPTAHDDPRPDDDRADKQSSARATSGEWRNHHLRRCSGETPSFSPLDPSPFLVPPQNFVAF